MVGDRLWRPALIYVASRLATLGAAAMAADLHPTFGLGGVLTRSWDANWYRMLAEGGYPSVIPITDGHAGESTLGFFPLYPLLMRAVHALGLSYPAAGLVVGALAGLAAAVLLWRLADHLFGPAAADRAVALFCFFPGAMILSLPYSEGLMLALAIGCLDALVRRQWVLAGVLAAFATATRPNAVALVAACGWAAAVAVWQRREWQALVAPVLAPLGIVAFFVYLRVHTGDAGAYFRTQREGWHQTIDLLSAWDTLSNFGRDPFADTNITLMTLGTMFLVIASVVLVRSRPPAVLLVYTAAIIAMALTSATMGARPRFLLTAFPLVAFLGEKLPPAVYPALLATFATLLGAFTIVSLTSILMTP